MILRRLAIPNTVTPIDIHAERVSQRQDGDDSEGAGGKKGGTVRFGAEIDYEGGHRANVD